MRECIERAIDDDDDFNIKRIKSEKYAHKKKMRNEMKLQQYYYLQTDFFLCLFPFFICFVYSIHGVIAKIN